MFSLLTLTSLGQRRLTNLSVTNVLLHFVRPFVPEKNNESLAVRLPQRQAGGAGANGLTGSGTLRPPRRARSSFPSRDGCRGAALAGTLQTEVTQHWDMNVCGACKAKGAKRAGRFRSHGGCALWLTDGFRKGMSKQSDAGCLGEE